MHVYKRAVHTGRQRHTPYESLTCMHQARAEDKVIMRVKLGPRLAEREPMHLARLR